jgi:hypothetical protein
MLADLGLLRATAEQCKFVGYFSENVKVDCPSEAKDFTVDIACIIVLTWYPRITMKPAACAKSCFVVSHSRVRASA